MYYAAFDHVNEDAKVAVVGITPGWNQMEIAHRAAWLVRGPCPVCLSQSQVEYGVTSGLVLGRRRSEVHGLHEVLGELVLGLRSAAGRV